MIRIRPGVELTETIQHCITCIEPHVPADLTLEITSGFRGPKKQLEIIADYAKKKNISFPEFNTIAPVDLKVPLSSLVPRPPSGIASEAKQSIYHWQRTWSKLLSSGVIINPPIAAELLSDHWITNAKGDKINRRGAIYPTTPHIRGTAFDISGKAGIDKITKTLDAAKTAGAPIANYVIERENNAVHVNCAAITIKQA